MTRKKDREVERSPVTPLDRMGPVGPLFNVRLRRVDSVLIRETDKVWGSRFFRRGTVGTLSYLIANPGSSQTELVNSMTFDKSAMHAIVNGLEKLGWAERRKSKSDKRRYEVYATPEGERELKHMVGRIREIESRLLSGLTVAEKAQLIELLDKVFENALNPTD